MVASIATELRSVMDDAVANEEPAGRGPIAQWVAARDAPTGFVFKSKTLNQEDAVRLATDGIKATNIANYLARNFECLSAGFGGRDGDAVDEQLAWIMASRTILDTPPPKLWLGTLVARTSEGCEDREELICLRPRCDSIRLKCQTSFGFLPLVEPKKGQVQLVVRSNKTYRRRGVEWDASGWKVFAFDPSTDAGAVLARNEATIGTLAFRDARGATYEWLGELKAEFAQRLASAFAANLSRPALEDSEWLRRSAQR